jgi:hypothetical protein
MLRELLLEEDAKAGSRKKLAEQLGISTHTIQSILQGEGLPDLAGEEVSRRRKLAWARTIARMALALNRDPRELLGSVGLPTNDDIEGAVRSETEKLSTHLPHRTVCSSPIDLLARGMLLSMEGTEAEGGRLELALRDYLGSREIVPPVRAGVDQLADGRFCRSCMSSLQEEHNAGPSEMYCRWCSDGDGALRPREQVLEVMSRWFSMWQSGISITEARRRADLYMRSMPAWAEDTQDEANGSLDPCNRKLYMKFPPI